MKKLFIILISGTGIIAIAIAIATWLSWQPQSWYDPPDFSNPDVAKLADRAEYRLNEEFHKVRSVDDVWHLRITDEAMNAWLSGRLEGWLTHDQELELPPEIKNPQVHVAPDGVWVAAMVEIDGDNARPVAFKLWITLENGFAIVTPVAIRLGKIPIPIFIFENIVEDLQKQMDGVASIIPLMDDREVEIQAIAFEEGAVVLSFQTHLPQ